MSKPFRVIDTGIRDGREQIAFDQALIDLHKAGEIPDTMRFLQFPPTALIGRHQALSKELNLRLKPSVKMSNSILPKAGSLFNEPFPLKLNNRQTVQGSGSGN